MKAQSLLFAVSFVLLTVLPPTAMAQRPTGTQNEGETLDQDAVKFFREQGLDESKVMEHLSWICDVYGPRLTGSPNIRRAQDWAVKQLTEWGIANAHLEEWGPFGRGWRLDQFSMEVVGENPWPVLAWPKAWSPGTDGLVEAEAVRVTHLEVDDLKALDLEGKIVLLQEPREVSEPFEGPARRYDSEDLLRMANQVRAGGAGRGQRGQFSNYREEFQRRQQMMRIIYEKKPLAILDRGSKGDYGAIFVSSASAPPPPPPPEEEQAENQDPNQRRRGGRSRGPRPWSPEVTGVIPQFTLAVEHYNRIHRLLEKNIPVKLALNMKSSFFDDDLMERNVVAEIPGTDPEIGDQVVMLGAHYDSWHSATGATDNGAGSAVMMEAMRLLSEWVKEKGTGPRRTIRIGLWSGEEQGLMGSRAYVEKHFGETGNPTAEHEKFTGYFNLDNGTGKVRGVYLQGNESIAKVFRSWLKPFHDLDASTLTLDNTGGTDHGSFDRVGLPGFQFIQDPVAYSPQTHHSSMDNWDHAIADDLKQASTIIASFAWQASQRDEMLPRKPAPQPRGDRGQGAGGSVPE